MVVMHIENLADEVVDISPYSPELQPLEVRDFEADPALLSQDLPPAPQSALRQAVLAGKVNFVFRVEP